MDIKEWITSELGRDIWHKKYQYNGETFEEWLDRVSGGNQNIRQLIEEKKFLFGGRILANRGLHNLGRKITYSNCYVITPPEDNIESIFDCAKKLARTYSYGGGCGVDISKLAPVGAKVNNAAKETSGSCSFMELYDLTTKLIGQNGRRGALMISLDCSHPDIEEFINLKSDLTKVTKANISIKITDEFMQAVRNDEYWTLSFHRPEINETVQRTVKAKELFNKMAKMNWDYSEPGLLNWDRINSWNLLSEDNNFSYAGVNPCAEEPLPAGGSCLLGSINLSEFVIRPFSDYPKFDFDEFEECVIQGVIALNEVLHEGLPLHPLQEQQESVNNWRQIGLGAFGWHDLLIKMGIRYGSKESFDLAERIGFEMINNAIKCSAELTDIYNVYPMYNKVAVLNSKFFDRNTDIETKRIAKEKGLANSQLLTIPPTGSIATMLGVSTALEPIYNISYTRKTESLHGKDKYYKVYTPIIEEYMKVKNISDENDLPEFINTAMTLNYKERIKMQAIWQSFIDASISSTVNVNEDFTIKETEDLYMLAWELGLKGVTLYRSGGKRVGILTNAENDNKEVATKQELPWGTVIHASDDLVGKKRKIVSGCGNLHVEAWFDPMNGKIMEVFLNKGSKGGCLSWMTGASRLISCALRTGTPFDYVIDQLKSAPTCPSYVTRRTTKKDTCKGDNCSSAIAYKLEEMQKQMFAEIGEEELEESKIDCKIKNPCPECGNELSFEGGCNSCKSCGFSKCN